MSIISNLNCPSFLVSSVFMVPLIVQLLIISQSCYLIDCLSLTELHSTLPSNQNNNRFKSRLSQEKSIRDVIRNLNHLHHQKLANNRDSIINSNNYHPQSIIGNNYDLIVDDFDNHLNQQYLPGLPVTNDDYDDINSPANIPNYLIVKSPTINGINKRQDEVVMDIPLEYTSDIPYEFYPELWPSNQQRSPSLKGKVDESDDLSSSDVLFQVLATKIAKLLKSESNEHNPQRKRVLVKRNHRSGLSGSPSAGGNHRARSSRVAPHLSGKPHLRTNNKPITDSKHRLSSSSSPNHGLSEDSKLISRKFGDSKKVKFNRIPLKSTLVGHQPVKGDFAKLVNGKAVHVAPMMIHSKVINSTILNHKESDKIKKKQPFISKNFRKTEATTHRSPTLNRKEKRDSNPLGLQSKSMKEFFNEIDLPKRPKSLAKRSISSRSPGDSIDFGLRQDDDSIDGYISNVNDSDDDDDDDSLDGNNGGRGEADIESEINEGEFRSSSPMVLQSNPWLVDEATRTLMRSLTVKRRKRGNINNQDDQLTLIGYDDDEEMRTSPTTTTTSIGDKDEDVHSNSKNSNYDQLKINEIDESTTSSSGKPQLTEIIEFEDIDEIPARIVKKDGVTLTEGHPDIDQDENDKINNEKRSNQELISNGSQLKSTIVVKSLVDGLDSDGDNETLLEEDFSEGLISIGDLDDLDKLNKNNSQLNSKNNDDDDMNDKNNSKPTDPIGSTSPPTWLTIVDVDQINGADDQIVNGSIDSDDQLLMETISKGLYVNNKRKRSITGDPYFGKVGGQEPSSLSLPVSSLVAQEAEKFIDVDDKLERIEETLILEALDLIKGNLNGQTGQLVSDDDNFKRRIESRLNAAYDLEDMRLALTDLHKIMQKISNEDENNDETIDRQLDNYNEIDDGPEGQEVFLDSIDKLSISTKLDSEDGDEDDGQQNLKGDTGIRNKEIGHLKIFPSNLTPINHRHPTTINKNHHLNQIKMDECPAVRALTTDCSTVKDVVPFGSLEKIFGQACNWHEVCYSCGELFGLLSSDCDMGFLEQSRLACNDSASCETASRLILMPLKSRRTFYKQKVPSICYQQPCIENFLLQSRRKR